MGRPRKLKLSVGDVISNMRILDIVDIKYGTQGRTEVGYKYRCEVDGYIGISTHSNILKMKQCPVCANKIVVRGVNDITTTDEWMVKYFLGGYDEACLYTRASSSKIDMRCPDCGYVKNIRINSITYQPFGCPVCGDGISTPNKIMCNLLNIIGLDFESEYSPVWAGNKRYDFYLPKYNTIIEMHGQQHYTKTFLDKPLKLEKQNDEIKEFLAITNGVERYIAIDCSVSNLEYIKNAILASDLFGIIGVDIECIDWGNIWAKSLTSKMYDVANMWNNQEINNVQEITTTLKLSKTTVCRYLNRLEYSGVCEYDGKQEIAKASKRVNGISVMIYKDGVFVYGFDSISDLVKHSEKNIGIKVSKKRVSKMRADNTFDFKGYTFKYVEENK